MVSAEKSKLFSLIILVGSLIGLILMLVDISSTSVNLITIIVVSLLLIAQIIVALYDFVSKKYLIESTAKIGFFCACLTLLFLMMQGIEFAIHSQEYEFWFKTRFYANFITGVVNIVLFFLKAKTR